MSRFVGRRQVCKHLDFWKGKSEEWKVKERRKRRGEERNRTRARKGEVDSGRGGDELERTGSGAR